MPLHLRIAKYIADNQPVTYDTLEARAITAGVDVGLFEIAMTQVHKHPGISVSPELVYTIKVVRPPSPTPHLDWLRDNYPPMTADTDGSGIDVDYSHLFLSPEELIAYKAEAKGGGMIATWQRQKGRSKPQSSNTSKVKAISVGGRTTPPSTTRSSTVIGLIRG